MNNLDAICTLAQKEAYVLSKNINNINDNIPWFDININNGGKRITNSGNYANHDNANRMQFFCDHLNANVMSHVEKIDRIVGRYHIELHDSNSYLVNGFNYKGCMVWAKNKQDRDVVLIPDPYQFTNYGGQLGNDTVSFAKKSKDKIGFFGSTTGSIEPVSNDRIKTCIWSLHHRDIIDCYITNIVQMRTNAFVTELGEETAKAIVHQPLSLNEIFDYKFLLDINGNTTSWSRVPQILNSQSILFKMPSKDMSWYYPLLRADTHYVHVNHHNMRSKIMYYRNNPKEVSFILENANRFVSDFLKPNHANLYMVALFDELAYLC
jgi:hypothetical protein